MDGIEKASGLCGEGDDGEGREGLALDPYRWGTIDVEAWVLNRDG